MSRTFIYNKNIESELNLKLDEINAGTIGKEIAQRAQELSPTDKFKCEVKRVSGGGVRVFSRWPVAHIIEWGSINNPRYAPMRRAVESLNLRFERAPK